MLQLFPEVYMDEELNDLSTDNLATTFSNDTDNTATSDELEASENYVNKMGTGYSIGKAIAKAVVITGVTVTAGAGGYAILSNSMVSNPATIADASFTYESDVDTLHYSFTITNSKEYPATFSLYHDSDRQVLFTLDVTKSDTYQGDITRLGYDRKIIYEVSYKANDYTGTLYKGNVTFTKNV
jgi:hypothetical protein